MGMKTRITWESFITCNQDARGIRYKFEDLCRQLFANENLLYNERFRYLHSNPNNPGIEIEPIFDEKNHRKISFQAKFFDGSTEYEQILHSAEQTVKYYAGKVDHIFLFCNKSLDINAKKFKRAKEILEKQSITLESVTDDAILDLVRKYPYLGLYYFGNHTISKKWFETYTNNIFDELGVRYNRKFNIDTKISEQLSMFLHDRDAIKYINHKKETLLKRIENLYKTGYSYHKYLNALEQATHELQDIGEKDIFESFSWKKIVENKIQSQLISIKDKRMNLCTKIKQQKELELNNGKESNKQKIQEQHFILNLEIQYLDALIDLPNKLEVSALEQSLLNKKMLFIDGQAGTGKSQLLANETNKFIASHKCALLLLAGDYLSDDPIQGQIMKRLSLEYTFDELLDILESLAEAENQIIPIFIDALNEAWYRQLWKIELPQILDKIEQHPMIKLILTYRPEYKKDLFSDQILHDIEQEKFLALHCRGFVDNSLSAITEFLNYYGIPFTPTNFLGYKMTNPLFLTLYCKTYNGEDVDLPMVYAKLLESINKNIHQRLGKELSNGYSVNDDLIEPLVNELSTVLIERNDRYISRNDFCKLSYWRNYGITPMSLTNLLIQEQLLHRTVIDDEEYIFFSYDQMNDFYCAKAITKKCTDKNSMRDVLFEQVLGIKDGEMRHPGNIDLFVNSCVLYAESYHEECIDIIASLNDDEKEEVFSRYVSSFQWRTSKYITREYFLDLLKTYPCEISVVWEMLISNSVKISHPFNADYLHELLSKYELNRRDALWTIYINKLDYEDSNRLVQLVRMYNQGDQLKTTNSQQNELLLTLFAWLLTSSNRWLRDYTSKAMVEILKKDFFICLKLLERFSTVNDPYVIQRLYGIVFGACCKRISDEKKEYRKLVQYVYNTIFNQEKVYPDILLRDYARLIIERYLFEYPNDEIDIEVRKITPPYRSNSIPNIEDHHYLDKRYSGGVSYIISSMRFEGMGIYGDFGRYVFQSALSAFDVDYSKIFNYAIYYILNILGYTEEYFGNNDGYCRNYNRHQTVKVERIGKKYQWIAMYHILAQVTDGCAMIDRYRTEEDKKILYEGTWEPCVRDFDPTLNNNFMKCKTVPYFDQFNIFMKTVHEETNKIDISTTIKKKDWLEKEGKYFCDLKNILFLKDHNGVNWISLTKYCGSNQQPPGTNPLCIWSWLYAYFVTPEQERAFVECAKKELSVINSETASHHEIYTVYNREYPWSPSCKEPKENAWRNARVKTGKKETITKKIPCMDGILQSLLQGAKLQEAIFEAKETYQEITEEIDVEKDIGKILHATTGFVWSAEYDASKEKGLSFHVPCAELLEELHLRQMVEDGFYYDESGKLAAFDTELTQKTSGVVLRRDLLDSFLCKKNLKLVWLMQAQKKIYDESGNISDWSDWEAVLSYTENGICGTARRIQK